MRNVLLIAGKEIQESLRNRWVLATTLLLAALALTLTLLGSAPTGSVGVRPLDVVIVSLSSLSVFLLPLIALLISHDAIVGEIERGTMLLLLSYPVGRWQVLLESLPATSPFSRLRRSSDTALPRWCSPPRGEIDADSLDAFGILVRHRSCSAPSLSQSDISSARWYASGQQRLVSPLVFGLPSSFSTTWVCLACSWWTKAATSRPRC